MLPNSSHPTTLRSALCRTFLIAQEWQKGRHREVAQVHRKSQQGEHAYNPSTEEQKQAGKPNTNGKLSFKAARQKVIQEDT